MHIKNEANRQAQNTIACATLFVSNTGQQRNTENHMGSYLRDHLNCL